jgi:hypothetical protein
MLAFGSNDDFQNTSESLEPKASINKNLHRGDSYPDKYRGSARLKSLKR